MKPKFTNDCDRCDFLWQIELSYGEPSGEPRSWDFYHCPAEGGTIVARWGDEGPCYASFTIHTIMTWGETECIPPKIIDGSWLWKAEQLIEEKGLFPKVEA